MFKKVFIALVSFCFVSHFIQAQNSEMGISIGASNYMGDLNTGGRLKKIRPAVSALYRYTVNDYVMLRAGAAFGMVAAADSVSNNPFQKARNLSFRSNIFELSGQIDLHFKKFKIGSEKHYYTPYLTSGLAIFHFQPKARYNDEVYNLREYGTEGQLSDFTGRKKYKLFQPAILLDDVSTTYVNQALLADPISRGLSDRLGETGIESIGGADRQRGDSVSKDGYWFTTTGITYTIVSKRCPTSK